MLFVKCRLIRIWYSYINTPGKEKRDMEVGAIISEHLPRGVLGRLSLNIFNDLLSDGR